LIYWYAWTVGNKIYKSNIKQAFKKEFWTEMGVDIATRDMLFFCSYSRNESEIDGNYLRRSYICFSFDFTALTRLNEMIS